MIPTPRAALSWAILISLLVLAIALPAGAVDKTFNVAAGDWLDDANWQPPGVPGEADTAILPSGRNATIDAPASADIAALTIAGGTLSGSGDVDVSGALTWNAGIITGSGTVSVGGLNLTTSGNLILGGTRTLRNEGASVWTGPGSFQLTAGAVVVNAGSLSIQTAADFFGGTLINTGTLEKTTGGASSNRTDVTGTFSNSGTVVIHAGILNLLGGYVQTAGATRLTGGQLQGSTLTFSGGLLSGEGIIIATVTNAGLIEPGFSVGTITINGGFSQTATGSLSIEISSLDLGDAFDRVNVVGAATLGGTLRVTLINSFTPNLGDQFRVMSFFSHTGDFAQLEGVATGGGFGFKKLTQGTGVVLEYSRELCGDRRDNDSDGTVDCADPKCLGEPQCPTPTSTPSASVTPTRTRTPSASPTATETETPTPSVTATSPPTLTPDLTSSPTETATVTETPTETTTPTETATPAETPTRTPSSTRTATHTRTATRTRTPTGSPTATQTITDTPAPTTTPDRTSSPTPTPTVTETATETATPMPTDTPDPSAPTFTETGTATPTPTATATPTAACTGDCDGDGMASEAEVLLVARNLFDPAQASACGVLADDGRFTVADVLHSVLAVAGGCSAP